MRADTAVHLNTGPDYLNADDETLRKMFNRLMKYSIDQCNIFKLDWTRYAEDFANDAIGALFEGKCPANCNQDAFLCKKVFGFVTNEIRNLKNRKTTPKESLDEIPNLRELPLDATYEMADISQKVYDAITEKVVEDDADDEVYALLEAYEKGFSKRADILTEAHLTVSQYENAKKRLKSITRNLPNELLSAVSEVLGRKNA